MSVRSLDTEQFAVVGVPSAAQQEARRRELNYFVQKSTTVVNNPYDTHIHYLRNSGKQRMSHKLDWSQVRGDIGTEYKIVDTETPTRLNKIHLIRTLAGK